MVAGTGGSVIVCGFSGSFAFGGATLCGGFANSRSSSGKSRTPYFSRTSTANFATPARTRSVISGTLRASFAVWLETSGMIQNMIPTKVIEVIANTAMTALRRVVPSFTSRATTGSSR